MDDVDPPANALEVVAKSPSGMVDAVRQALSGAATALGSLERCNATIVPQVVYNDSGKQFQIMLSVTKR